MRLHPKVRFQVLYRLNVHQSVGAIPALETLSKRKLSDLDNPHADLPYLSFFQCGQRALWSRALLENKSDNAAKFTVRDTPTTAEAFQSSLADCELQTELTSQFRELSFDFKKGLSQASVYQDE